MGLKIKKDFAVVYDFAKIMIIDGDVRRDNHLV